MSGGVAKTLKAVAYQPGLGTTTSDVTSAIFNPWAHKPNEDWYDNRGVLLETHGGGITYANGFYYWCGNPANKVYPPGNSDIPRLNSGVVLYKSADLYNWTYVGQILSVPSFWVEMQRPHIVFNPNNNTYVLWAHAIPRGTNLSAANRAAIATSLNIESGWTWQNTNYLPAGVGSHDFNLFVDTDNTGYLVHVNDSGLIQISQLTSDYLTTNGNGEWFRCGEQSRSASPVQMRLCLLPDQ